MKDLKDLQQAIGEMPHKSPVAPIQLGLDDTIQFQCRKGIACFNQCCQNIDITLTPYDVLRLSRHLGIPTWEFLMKHTLPFEMDAHGLPGIKLRPREDSPACQFVTEQGCSVYQDRPAACRYYAMGSMGLRKKDSPSVEDIFFMVREEHCLGHAEPRTVTVREYRREQGVEIYDEMNRDWRELVLKKRSSGPTVGRPSQRSLELFYMGSYDLDSFRLFVQSDSFQNVFDLDAETAAEIREDDEALLRFAMRFLRQVLFGVNSIPLKAGAREQRVAERKEHWERKRQEAVQAHLNERYDAPDEG